MSDPTWSKTARDLVDEHFMFALYAVLLLTGCDSQVANLALLIAIADHRSHIRSKAPGGGA